MHCLYQMPASMCDSRCMVHGLQLQEVLCSLHISTAYKLTCLWLQLAKESRGAHLLENLWPESLKFLCFIAGLRWQEGLVCFLRPVARQGHTREASAPLNSFGLRLNSRRQPTVPHHAICSKSTDDRSKQSCCDMRDLCAGSSAASLQTRCKEART